MIDTIVQEVRESRAQIAAEFGYDRAKFWHGRKSIKRLSEKPNISYQQTQISCL
jgi:hypothetical protein